MNDSGVVIGPTVHSPVRFAHPHPPCDSTAPQLDCSNRAKAVTLRPSGPAIGAPVGKHQDLNANVHPAEAPSLLPERGQFSSAEVVDDGLAGEPKEALEECFYYSFCPDDSHRFIALDTYDVNAIREEPGPDELTADDRAEEEEEESATSGATGEEGMEVLSKHNPNRNKNDAQGMDGLNKRYPLGVYGMRTTAKVSSGACTDETVAPKMLTKLHFSALGFPGTRHSGGACGTRHSGQSNAG